MKRHSRHLLWFAFSLSLLFNVFFAAGYMRTRAEAGNDSARAVGMVAKELDLDDRQAAAFASLRNATDDVLRPGIALAQQELLAELDRAQPDAGRIRTIVARQTELIEQQRIAGFDRMCEFVQLLNPEQRRRLSHRLRHGGPYGGERRAEMLKRFDGNGDGELDEAEMAEARAAFETRRAEHRKRREESRRRFDADGDGALDDEEEAAFDAWRREQWRERRGR